MTLEELTRHTSPYLLCWIDLAIAPRHLSVPYDLKKIKRLTGKDFPVPHSEYTQKKLAYLQNFLASRKGDWALLGEMTGLQVLEFPRRTPPGIIEDFSFLPRLTHLKHLDLQYTGFKDCSLLTGLNELKQLSLPARKSCSIRKYWIPCPDAPSAQTNRFIRMTVSLLIKYCQCRRFRHFHLTALPFGF